ncbi:MAG TPA: hypothetical protein VHO24_20855 [Opitutaceae bacterium]|nr:hypothetical protein [Opitutaceae bacterium]
MTLLGKPNTRGCDGVGRPRLGRFFFAALAGWLAVSRAVAHEPLDISTRITIHGDRLELVSTLGTDGMRQLLASTGSSPAKIAESLRSLGPDKPVLHAPRVAARFFSCVSNGQPLVAKTVKSVSEGAEILLTVIFPRPAPGTLVVRATCYETIPGLHKGVLLIEDEPTGPLDSAMLSSAKMQLTVTVPD